MKISNIYIKVYGYLTLAVAIATGMASCSDVLDEVPDNRTEIDTPVKVAQLLTSGYPQSTPAVLCELFGDNLVDNNVCVPGSHRDYYAKFHGEAYRWEDVDNYSTDEDDTPYQVWDAYYQGIAVCNHAIEAMKKMSKSPSTDPSISPYWGEAHVLRSYLHFVLANVFAESYQSDAANAKNKCIPYVTIPEDKVQVDYGTDEYRKSVKEAYALMEKDLQEGLECIDDAAYSVAAYHFNKRAANAYAARFYLYTRQYEKAEIYATRALENSTLRNWSTISSNTINSMLTSYNSEALSCNYLLQTTYSLQDRMLSACRYAINDGNAAYGIPSTKNLIYDGGGAGWSGRLGAFDGKIYRWGAGSEYGSWLFRVYEYFEYSDKIAGIGFVHMIYQPFSADQTILDRAEARLYLDNVPGCISDLNQWAIAHQATQEVTKARILTKYAQPSESNMYDSKGLMTNIYANDTHQAEMGFEKVLTGEDHAVLNAVLHFRRIETHFEGHRWFDIKRFGITVRHAYREPTEYVVHVDELKYNDPRRVMQIPNNVREAGYPSNDRTHTAPAVTSANTETYFVDKK